MRIGGLEGFETDVEIPLKYGIDQCVGDTLCTGGIMYGQRVIAEMLNFCKDIREVSEPGAIMLNYSNPNAMATWRNSRRTADFRSSWYSKRRAGCHLCRNQSPDLVHFCKT